MCIRVVASGCVSTHISVLIHLMRGEYDSRLVWPFRGDITIQLVNHSNDQYHWEWTVHFSDAALAAGSADRVTTSFISHSDVDSIGRGYGQFISHSPMWSPLLRPDDTLSRVKVVVHSVRIVVSSSSNIVSYAQPKGVWYITTYKQLVCSNL